MGRPSAVSPEFATLLESIRRPGLTPAVVFKAFRAAGGTLSEATVRRYLARSAPVPSHMAPPPRYVPGAALKRQAAAALESDDLSDLRATKAAIAAAMRQLEGTLAIDPKSITGHRALLASLSQVTSSIQELTPRTAEDRYAPIEGEALAALLARAEASAKLDEDLRGRIRRQQIVIDQLVEAGPG